MKEDQNVKCQRTTDRRRTQGAGKSST